MTNLNKANFKPRYQNYELVYKIFLNTALLLHFSLNSRANDQDKKTTPVFVDKLLFKNLWNFKNELM